MSKTNQINEEDRAIVNKAITLAKQNGFYSNPENVKLVADFDASNGRTLYQLIFNHEFCKALWPNKVHDNLERELWKGHLALMVVSEDPISYLGEHLDE